MSTKRAVATASIIDRASILCSEENLPIEEARIKETLKNGYPKKFINPFVPGFFFRKIA